MNVFNKLVCALVFSCLWAGAGHAAVVDSSDVGFTLKFEAQVNAAPMKCYRGVAHSVGKWWSSEHTYSGDAGNMYIEDRLGGCFCEKFPTGGGIEHMRVVYSNPGSGLRLLGALGPLQEMGLQGSMTWEFAAKGDGTLIKLTYAVGGYSADGLAVLAPIVDRVIGEQFGRLVRFLETGFPVAKE